MVAAVCVWAATGASLGDGTAEVRPLVGRPEVARSARAATPSRTSATTTTTTTTTTALPAAAPSTAAVTAAPLPSPPPTTEPIRDDPVPRVASTRAGAPPAKGRIKVPRIGLDTVFYEGGTTAEIDHGPSHMPRTAHPGHDGNTVFAGHRVTYTAPFRDLDRLQRGDTVTFVVPWGTFTYAFTHHEVVEETDTEILRPRGGRTATIFTCHPKGSDRYRLVAYFDLASAPAMGPEGAAKPNENYAPADPSVTTTTAPPAGPPPSSTTSTSLVLPGRK